MEPMYYGLDLVTRNVLMNVTFLMKRWQLVRDTHIRLE